MPLYDDFNYAPAPGPGDDDRLTQMQAVAHYALHGDRYRAVVPLLFDAAAGMTALAAAIGHGDPVAVVAAEDEALARVALVVEMLRNLEGL